MDGGGCNHWRVPFSNVFLLQCIQSSKPNLTLHYRFWLKFSWGPKYDVLLKEKFCKRWNCHWLKMRNEGSVRQRKTFPIRLTTLCAELCFLLYFGHRKKSQIFYLLEDKMFHPSDLKQKEQTFVFKQQKVSFEKIHQKFFLLSKVFFLWLVSLFSLGENKRCFSKFSNLVKRATPCLSFRSTLLYLR